MTGADTKSPRRLRQLIVKLVERKQRTTVLEVTRYLESRLRCHFSTGTVRQLCEGLVKDGRLLSVGTPVRRRRRPHPDLTYDGFN